ncbi:MAG: hypothetical protein ABSA51_03135 [Anaerolineaceae bacterium]
MGLLVTVWNRFLIRSVGLGIILGLAMALVACNASKATSPIQTTAPTIDEPSQLLSLVDNYLNCINTNTNGDLQNCIDMLPSQPGEIRETITANPGTYLNQWQQYKYGYQLYFCSDNTVLEGYIEYKRDNLARPVSPTPNYLRYTFESSNAATAPGWRIAQVFSTVTDFNAWRDQNGFKPAANIMSDCEFMPRINHTPLNPSG